MKPFRQHAERPLRSGPLELLPFGPFSWPECLVYLGRSELEIMHRVEDGRVCKAAELSGIPVLLELDGSSRPDKGKAAGPIRMPDADDGNAATARSFAALRVSFPRGGDTPELRAAAADYVREWFGLDEDLEPFYAMAMRDPLLGPVVSEHAGLRLIGIPDLFESLVWAVIGQQISLPFAYTMKNRLVETYGQRLDEQEVSDAETAPFYLFPRPARIAALTPDDLRPMQFSGRKAEYIIGIARMMEEGRLSKAALLRMDEIEAREALLRIRGVGAWTADYVGMKCLRRPSAFPSADAGLHQALKIGLGLNRKPLPDEIARAAADWKSFEAYAVFYLWQSLLPGVPGDGGA
ncbi:DNA-3-methyladenine glycosylase 2 [Saccharibacillus alkalitolerans]|uniref:DNA-3-methyladenine glycosylase II n=1 Tax=Saccharibacillus alkalitolerans TaxID=2705290 RepID=A0ABX0F814_9BACL|nr:DNA-3-methyladenine glycosylase 2 [Saccharibacillus alkalitolerans]NGZ77093.1 DNA-3-methyladenine glycosylase 2 [Saccharibacillus alkalitolerans]